MSPWGRGLRFPYLQAQFMFNGRIHSKPPLELFSLSTSSAPFGSTFLLPLVCCLAYRLIDDLDTMTLRMALASGVSDYI